MTLTDFLLARIDAEEQMATAAGHGFGHQPIGAPRNAGWTDIDETDNVRPSYDRRFISTWSPARVLAECAAKRRIIAMSDGGADFEAAMPTPGYAQPYHSPSADVMTRTRQLLALPYADHPDYDEAWRP